MLLTEVNNAIDSGPLFLTPMTANASDAIH